MRRGGKRKAGGWFTGRAERHRAVGSIFSHAARTALGRRQRTVEKRQVAVAAAAATPRVRVIEPRPLVAVVMHSVVPGVGWGG